MQPGAFSDARGIFKETYVRSKYSELGITDNFVQDSASVSRQYVVRGLHADLAMSKLVQVLQGEVYDVIVDARNGSPTFGRWEAFLLNAENHSQLYIPAGCLHGFQVLSESAVFCYKQSAEYDPSREVSVLWKDPTLRIAWPAAAQAILSAKDAGNQLFADAFSA